MRTPPIVGLYAKTIRNRRLAARDLSSPCHCEERRDEAIHSESLARRMDCFASLAMTGLARGRHRFPHRPCARRLRNYLTPVGLPVAAPSLAKPFDRRAILDKKGPNLKLSRYAKDAIVLGLFAAIGPFAIDMYLPALPNIAANLHASTAATQMTLTLFFLAFGLCQIVYGPISDMIGRKPPLYF